MMTLTQKVVGVGTATLAAATIGANLSVSPAQAASLGGIAITGSADFVGPGSQTITFLGVSGSPLSDPRVERTPTGVFSGIPRTSPVQIQDLVLTNVRPGVIPSQQIADFSAINTFVSFADGTTFDLFAGQADRIRLDDRPLTFLVDARGQVNLTDGRRLPGLFNLTATTADGITSFNADIEAVPEPLTIIGSGLALGFGTLFKSQRSKSKKKDSIA